MCMATLISSFSLSDGDGTSWASMKLATSNRSKQEIVTTSCCFKKCGDNKCVPCKASSDGSTPCIAWMASCALMRSKYGALCFLKSIFFQKGFYQPSPPLFFLHFGEFSPQKKRCPEWCFFLFFSLFPFSKSSMFWNPCFKRSSKKHLMLKRRRKKGDIISIFVFFVNACWVWVAGRQGRTHLTSLLTIILDLFKGFFFKIN